ncbi:hypothetical protein HPB51_014591 [Rhipicephalus microplus]|uniref:DH domain-containing protein n=1 Tax=Rhipicephalus microplus TaxID=6941 RepID=A0A9J6F3B4_RHIMP|nr:hypothetical protein HPB51_014591 [Rhipicephalus microplus]
MFPLEYFISKELLMTERSYKKDLEVVVVLDERYLEALPHILERLYTGPHCEQLCREFELLRDCYLPLSLFLLRPVHRIFHYCSLFEKMLQQLGRFTTCHKEALHRLENHIKMTELERDLLGLDNLNQPGRFSDMLVYASRVSSSGPRLQFKVHGQLPLQGLMVEETEPKAEAAFRFTIYAANRALMVAAGIKEV